MTVFSSILTLWSKGNPQCEFIKQDISLIITWSLPFL